MLYAALTVIYLIVGTAPDKGRLISNLERFPMD